MRACLLLVLVLVPVLVGGCTIGTTTVRMCNNTGHPVSMLKYDDSFFDVPTLTLDECSPYVEPDHDVYRYTYVRFNVGTDHFEITPIDFVGEKSLGGGAWSYHLTIYDFASHGADVHAVAD